MLRPQTYFWLTDRVGNCIRFPCAPPRASTSHEIFVTMTPASNTLKGVIMTTEGHIAALERRHQELDRQIQAEMQNRRIDDLMVSALKRKKLELKDELSRLQGALRQ